MDAYWLGVVANIALILAVLATVIAAVTILFRGRGGAAKGLEAEVEEVRQRIATSGPDDDRGTLRTIR